MLIHSLQVLAIPIQICFIAGYVTSTYLLGSGELTQESCEARDVQPTNLTVNMESPCPTRMLLQISLAINGVGLNACGFVFILLILCELNRVQWFKMIVGHFFQKKNKKFGLSCEFMVFNKMDS